MFATYDQQDSHELLVILIDMLHSELQIPMDDVSWTFSAIVDFSWNQSKHSNFINICVQFTDDSQWRRSQIGSCMARICEKFAKYRSKFVLWSNSKHREVSNMRFWKCNLWRIFTSKPRTTTRQSTVWTVRLFRFVFQWWNYRRMDLSTVQTKPWRRQKIRYFPAASGARDSLEEVHSKQISDI